MIKDGRRRLGGAALAAALAVGSGLVASAGTAPASAVGEPVIERYAGVGPGPGPATQMFVSAEHLATAGNVVYAASEVQVLRIDLDAHTGEMVAGGGSDRGDGGPAADAELDPNGIAVHGSDLFVSDPGRNTVRRVDLGTGLISTYAGTPDTGGFAGDGGPAATGARLSGPGALAVDGTGNLLIADVGNGRIRRVDHATHVITSIGDDGGGGPASVSDPAGLAIDAAGNVYVSEPNNYVVQRIDHASGLVTTVAGDGTQCADPLAACGDGGPAPGAQLDGPAGLAISGSMLFVADVEDLRIRAVDLGSGVITTVAGTGAECQGFEVCGDGGPATAAAFYGVTGGLAVDGGGHVLTGDDGSGGFYLRRFTPGGLISTVAGAGFANIAGMQGTFDAKSTWLYPFGVTVGPDGTVYVGNYSAVIAIAPDGTGRVFAGGAAPSYLCMELTEACGDGGPATEATLVADPFMRTAVGPDGSVYITNLTKIRKVDPHGTITTIAGDGTQCADLAQACGDGGPATAAQFTVATGITTDGAGNVYFLDVDDGYFTAGKVRRIDAHTGVITTVAGDGTACADPGTGCGDGGPATHAQVGGVALRADSAGNLYLGDLTTGTIRRVDAHTGTITKVAGGGSSTADHVAATDAQLGWVFGLGVDGDGNVYAAASMEEDCSVVVRIDTRGFADRVAGRRDACGWTGDGGPATSARLGFVYDLDAGPDGTVYVADTTNFQIRRVVTSAAPPTATTTTAPVPPATPGLWVIGGEASLLPVGGSGSFGHPGSLNAPLVDVVSTSSGHGYWLVGADGGVFAYGDAEFFGSTGDRKLVAPITGIAATATDHGYWLVAADGGVFAFGGAEFFGSTGGTALNAPVRGLAPTPSGDGYWLVAADGGVFAFGDAGYFGSMAGHRLSSPVVGIASTPSGNGYWLVAADGGVFAFGDAGFYGSMAGHALNAPVARIVPTGSGHGYRLVARDRGVFAFGDAPGPN